jgi:hypothetical protein
MNIHHQSPLSIEQEFMNLALDNQKGVHVSWREEKFFLIIILLLYLLVY